MVEHAPELEVFNRFTDFRDVTLYRAHRGVVGLGARQPEQLGAVGQVRLQVRQRIDYALELLFLAAQVLRSLRVVPDLRVFELLRYGA